MFSAMNRGQKIMIKTKNVCWHCAKMLVDKRPNQRFCSPSCSDAYDLGIAHEERQARARERRRNLRGLGQGE
jgi:hypothetical protein